MEIKLKQIKEASLTEIKSANNLSQLEEVRVAYFSKKGHFSLLMQGLRDVDADKRPQVGKLINEAKTILEKALLEKREILENEVLLEKLKNDKIDVTLPGVDFNLGTIHPLSQVIEDLEDLFTGLGYEIAEGPEVETDYYNFEMMNIPKDHPARAMQDTFYIDDNLLLRTHTSPVQARTMLAKKGEPFKIICPGKTYRRDQDDLTHSHQFMQIEGLVVDKDVSFANLKDTLLTMVKHLFGDNREIRLRPSYFQFTEPSVEVDVVYTKKDGTKSYIEVLGAGVVHPDVLKMGGYDPNVYSGFAFGIGVERIAILKHHIDDIRSFYANDIRFLKQFKQGVNSDEN